MQKNIIIALILSFYVVKNGIAQVNSTFALAAKLVGIAKQVQQRDSLAQVLLAQSAFSDLSFVLSATNIEPFLNADKAESINVSALQNLVLRYTNAHVILEYLLYAAQNKTIRKNKLIEKSRILRPFQYDIAALADNDLEADTLVQAMRDVEQELLTLPTEYSVKTVGPKPPKQANPATTGVNSLNNATRKT